MREPNKPFEQSFREFIINRLMVDLDILLSSNGELKAVYEESTLHFENVRMAVSEGNKKLFEEYIDQYKSAQAAAGGIIAEISYIQGMKDAYRLFRLLEATGSEEDLK